MLGASHADRCGNATSACSCRILRCCRDIIARFGLDPTYQASWQPASAHDCCPASHAGMLGHNVAACGAPPATTTSACPLFPATQLPREFYDDFVTVAADECRHFLLLEQRLQAVGSHYGARSATS